MDATTHIFEKSILKAYDIRGIVDKNLNEIDAYFIGKSYGTFLRRNKRNTCVLGYDGRHSSQAYSNFVAKGLLETGVNVVNIGLMPTPAVYFALFFLDKSAGIIVTASHNPPEYNGFKMLTNAEPVWGDNILKLGEISASGDFEVGKGTLTFKDIREDYIGFLLNVLKDKKDSAFGMLDFFEKFKISNNKECKQDSLKIVWDSGNGATSGIVKEIVKRLPGTHKTICDTVDPDFPNHHPDPAIAKNMKMLQDEVLKNHFDLGIAFDGDGDRIGIVDNEGFIFYGDQLLDVLARDFLKDFPGEKVMSEVKASKVLYDDIVKYGGQPVMWKPGHSSQKAKMKSDNIKLAGETSGHIFYGENHNFDDALFAAMKLIKYISTNNIKLADIRKAFPRTYASSEIRVKVSDDRRFQIPSEIAERMRQHGRKFNTIDGIRVDTDDGWWLIRASNTEPAITVRCEALSPEGFELCKNEIVNQLNLSGCDMRFD